MHCLIATVDAKCAEQFVSYLAGRQIGQCKVLVHVGTTLSSFLQFLTPINHGGHP